MANTDLREAFQKGLDLHQPDWWITFATQAELIEFVRYVDQARGGLARARDTLRRQVCDRLFMPVRAAVEAKIVGPGQS